MGIQTSAVSTDEMTTNDEAHGGNSGATVAESNGKGLTIRRCVDGPRRMRDEFVSRSLEFHGELYSDGQTAHGLRGGMGLGQGMPFFGCNEGWRTNVPKVLRCAARIRKTYLLLPHVGPHHLL